MFSDLDKNLFLNVKFLITVKNVKGGDTTERQSVCLSVVSALEKSVRSYQPLKMEMLKHCKKYKQTFSSGWVQKAAGSVEVNNKNKTRTHSKKEKEIRYKKNKIEKKVHIFAHLLCTFKVFINCIFVWGGAAVKCFIQGNLSFPADALSGNDFSLKLMFYAHGEMFPGSKPGDIQT